jgi:hypothetical protein
VDRLPDILIDASPGSLDRRLAKVSAVLATRIFATVFRWAVTRAESDAAIADYDRLRTLARHVLVTDFGCDLSGIALTFAWDPATKQLDIWCRPEATAARIAAVLEAIRQQQAEGAASA